MNDLFRKALEKIPVDMEYANELGSLYRAYAEKNTCMLASTSFNYGLLVGLKLAKYGSDLSAADTLNMEK